MAGFKQGSLDILRAERLRRNVLLSALLEFLKINRSASLPFGYFSKGKSVVSLSILRVGLH
jgi:hypothetical protein